MKTEIIFSLIKFRKGFQFDYRSHRKLTHQYFNQLNPKNFIHKRLNQPNRPIKPKLRSYTLLQFIKIRLRTV